MTEQNRTAVHVVLQNWGKKRSFQRSCCDLRLSSSVECLFHRLRERVLLTTNLALPSQQVDDSFKRDHPTASEPSAAKAAELQRACKAAKETFQEDPDLHVQTITVASYCCSSTGEDVILDVNISREAYDEALSGLMEACLQTVDEAIKVTEKATAAGSDVRSECPPFDRSKLDKVSQRFHLCLLPFSLEHH